MEFSVEADVPNELLSGMPDDWKEDLQIEIRDEIYDVLRDLADDHRSDTEGTIRSPSQLPVVTLKGEADGSGSDVSSGELTQTVFAALPSTSNTTALSAEMNRTENARLARNLAEAIRSSTIN